MTPSAIGLGASVAQSPVCPALPSNVKPVWFRTNDPASLHSGTRFPKSSYTVNCSTNVHSPATLPATLVETVSRARPVTPSLLAMIVVTPPADPPDASPVPPREAAVGLVLDQVTARPVSGFPAASLGVAVNCTLAPGAIVSVGGVTVTDAIGTRTDTAAEPLFPPELAVTVADPGTTAVTRPDVETVATPGLSLDHTTGRKNRRFPCASLTAATSCVVALGSRLTDAGLTVTDAMGSCRTALQLPVEPSPQERGPLRLEAGVPVA